MEERLRMLRERFALGLPERVAAIRRTWIRLHADPVAAGVREELARQLHTLGGTAGSYGLFAVSGLAIEGEITCEDLGVLPDSETLPYLATIIEDIGKAAGVWLEGETTA